MVSNNIGSILKIGNIERASYSPKRYPSFPGVVQSLGGRRLAANPLSQPISWAALDQAALKDALILRLVQKLTLNFQNPESATLHFMP